MGKKKRGNKQSKQDRKQEIQARRERQLEAATQGGEGRSESKRMHDLPYSENSKTVEDESIEILVGDRVFCIDDYHNKMLRKGDSRRGTIRDIVTSEDSTDATYFYLPINRKDEEENRIRLSRKDLIRDTYPLYPRFDIGDSVYIMRDEWKPAIVRDIFPPDLYLSDIGMFAYRVAMVEDLGEDYSNGDLDNDDRLKFCSVPHDTTDYIIERTDKFRLKVGDEVSISAKLAAGIKLNANYNSNWIRGHIVDIDKCYGRYICEYRLGLGDNKKDTTKKICYVWRDDDELIALFQSSPRERLFDAIHQNCSYEHFVSLISENKLDVSSFKDLVLDAAIISANYGALLWLQEHTNILLSSISDSEGGGLLHKIARSPYAHRFFKAHFHFLNEKKEPLIQLELQRPRQFCIDSEAKKVSINQKNKRGQVFLFGIVESGNIRCLEEIILSDERLGYSPFRFLVRKCDSIENICKDDENTSLIQYMRSKEQWEMCILLEQYHKRQLLDQLHYSLEDFGQENQVECKIDMIKKVSLLTNYGDETLRRRLFCHLDENQKESKKSKDLIRGNINKLPIMKWLISHMQPEDLSQLEFTTFTRADSFEYVQPEMYSLLSNSNGANEDGMDSRARIYFDLVSCIVHEYDGVWFHEKVKEEASKYYSRFLDKLHEHSQELNIVDAINQVLSHERKCDRYRESLFKFEKSCLVGDVHLSERIEDVLNSLVKEKGQSPTLHEHSQELNIVDIINEELSHNWECDRYRESLFKFKKSCLVDDVHLSERIDVLNYLVKEKGQSPPHALDAIKWRQCGVLRWLANESYIKLEDPACLSEHLLIRARTALKVTNNIKINRLPKTVSIATFLAFVCVEYDDLFSLQWILSQLPEPKNEDFWISGWNLFHACAFFGRIEIFFHLVQTTLESTLNQVCERKSFRNCYSSHIAAMKGFTKLCGYLLDAGCPPHTTEGKTVYDLTKDSSYDHVREWGNSRNEIDFDSIEMDIKRLLSLLEAVPCNIEAIKGHITKTKCMDITLWRTHFDCYHVDQEISGGELSRMTYRDILESIFRAGNTNLTIWLLEILGPDELDGTYAFENSARKQFWLENTFCSLHRCIKFSSAVEMVGEKKFLQLLNMDIFSHETIGDPSDMHPMINYVTKYHSDDENVSERVRKYQESLLKEMILHTVIDGINLYMSNEVLKHRVSIDEIERHRELFDWAIDTLEDHCSCEYEVPDHFVLRKGGNFFVSAPSWQLLSLYRDSPLCHQLIIYAQESRRVQINHIMAFEGYEDLTLWSLSPRQNTWTIEDEIISTRIAACSGQTGVVSIFLEDSNIHVQFKSTLESRVKAALLGAAESGRKKDVMGYLKNVPLSQDDICIDEKACMKIEEEQSSETHKKVEAKSKLISSTLVGSSVFGYLTSNRHKTKDATESDDDHLQIIGSIMNNTCADAGSMTVAIHQSLDTVCFGYLPDYQRCLELFKFLVESRKFNVWRNQKCVHKAISQLVRMVEYEEEDVTSLITVLNDFLDFAIIHGVDIQTVFPPYYPDGQNEAKCRAIADLDTAKMNQCKIWAHFDMIEKGDALSSIQMAIDGVEKSWCNREGLGLVHLVAAYDRKDVLIWLVEEKKVSLFQVDGSGRTVLEVAQACSSTDVLQWLVLQHAKLTVSTFTACQYRRKKAQQKYRSFLDSLRWIQARYRGRKIRRLYHGILSQKFRQVHQFNTIWNKATSVLDKTTGSLPWLSWKKIKIEEDDQASLLEEFTDFGYTAGALGNDLAATLHLDEEHEGVREFEEEGIDHDRLRTNCEQYNEEVTITTEYDQHQLKCLQLTKDVIKWLRKCDPKYREFFQRRMKQLADGDRSRILAKGLTGCKTRIFESYLEQKSGFRILWTKMSATDIRVWYVSKHDDVSKHIKLIDEAEKRSRRQLVGALEVDEVGNLNSFTIDNDIMLDPKCNTPMKVYEVTYTNIERLQDLAWHPPIYLTKEERKIVETNGTVLVVGRSGCGKTICICNRMDYDWRRHRPNNPSFSQLFVSRSTKLRNFVKETVEGCLGEVIESRRFETFPHILRSLESKLPVDEEQSYSYVPSQKMTFTRFKNEIYSFDKSCSIGALTIWKNIHVCIKGSVESLANEEGLSESEYMCLGVRQCKLLPYQRRAAYRAYESYRKYLKEKKLWDDSDRIRSIVRRLNIAAHDDPNLMASIRENKIYVDEVQDYLQIEILLFFMLSGPGALFLAGDPAQSVVDGVDFQFKDVRMVGFHLFGEEKRDLIPNKPMKVNLNFRSHSGILQVASAVLDCLSSAFPNSIAQIGSDKAVFQGPRPSLLYKVSFKSLQQLSKKVQGIVFLTHDENKFNLRRALEQYPLVLGIREVKGLEFQSVVIVDYFGELSNKYQKVWRDLLLGRQIDFQKFPELESHLKLLYTGITRSMQRLLFAETSSSIAGEAFVRWSSTTTVTAWNRMQALAVPQSVNDVEAMTRTKDEWRSAGVDNAMMAEQEDIELTEAEEWLEKAMYCFSKSGDTELAMKARTHRKAINFQLSFISQSEEDQVNGLDFLTLELRELRAAEMMAQLFQERLILEAHRLAMNIMPMILKSYSEDQIATYLLDKFPSEKEMEELL